MQLTILQSQDSHNSIQCGILILYVSLTPMLKLALCYYFAVQLVLKACVPTVFVYANC